MKRLLLLLALAVAAPVSLLAAAALSFPELSDVGGAERYYKLYSYRAGKVLKDNGADSKATLVPYSDEDATNWQLVLAGAHADNHELDTFKIVSKAGNELQHKQVDNDNTDFNRFITVAAGGGNTFIFKEYSGSAGFMFQLWCIEKGEHINRMGDEIGAWSGSDDGNSFSAITSYSDLFEGAPALSTAGDTTWHLLQFQRNGNKAITANGQDQKVIQQALAFDDKQLFRMEGSYSDGFKVISKIDNMEFKYVGDRINLVAAGGGDLFSFARHPNSPAEWKLKHNTNGNFINELNGQDAGLYGGEGGNNLKFLDDSYDPYAGAPALSTSAAPKWYHLHFPRYSKTITASEVDSAVTSQGLGINNNQLFRLEGSYSSFKIISTVEGAELSWSSSKNGFILASSGSGDAFSLVRLDNSPTVWELKHNTNGLFVTDGFGLGDWHDDGNWMRFIDDDEYMATAYVGAPALSTSGDTTWYYIQFVRNGSAMTANGQDQKVIQQSLVVKDEQLFRMEGDYTGFKVISKIGNMEFKYVEDRINLVATGSGDLFSFAQHPNSPAEWKLKHNTDGRFINESGSTDAGLYGGNDGNNLKFIDDIDEYMATAYIDAPELSASAEPKWYYIQLMDNNNALTAEGENNKVIQQSLEAKDEQLFRMDGDYLGFKVISKISNMELKLATDGDNKDKFILVASGGGDLFSFAKHTNSPAEWKLKHNTNGNFINPQSPNIGLWGGDDRNNLKFIPTRQLTVTVTDPAKGSVSTSGGLYLDGEELSVAATPAPYNRLLSWAIDGEVSPETGDTLKLKIDRNISLAATFVGVDTLLGSLTLTGDGDVISLIPAFDPNTSSYIATALPGTQTVTIAAAARSSESTVTGAGDKSLLANTDTTFYITVTAEDDIAQKTYSVSVRWADPTASNDVSLTLSLNGGAATPLTADTATFNVPSSSNIVTIAATVAAGATILGDTGTVTLTGENTAFSIMVLAANGTDSRTYTVIAHRLSSDATLRSLTAADMNGASIALTPPTFAPDREEYTVRTSSGSVTVSAAASHRMATVAYTPDDGTLPTPAAGATGDILITVTAEEGNTKTYKVTVSRAGSTAVEAVALGSLTVYPNPAAGGEVKIVNGTLKAGERIEIYSFPGTLVATYKVSAGPETAINISRLPQGVYIVKAGKYATKLINN
jgi:hypothetical protein